MPADHSSRALVQGESGELGGTMWGPPPSCMPFHIPFNAQTYTCWQWVQMGSYITPRCPPKMWKKCHEVSMGMKKKAQASAQTSAMAFYPHRYLMSQVVHLFPPLTDGKVGAQRGETRPTVMGSPALLTELSHFCAHSTRSCCRRAGDRTASGRKYDLLAATPQLQQGRYAHLKATARQALPYKAGKV